jgi:hypothetical protein
MIVLGALTSWLHPNIVFIMGLSLYCMNVALVQNYSTFEIIRLGNQLMIMWHVLFSVC